MITTQEQLVTITTGHGIGMYVDDHEEKYNDIITIEKKNTGYVLDPIFFDSNKSDLFLQKSLNLKSRVGRNKLS